MRASLKNNGIWLTLLFSLIFIGGIVLEKKATELSGRPLIVDMDIGGEEDYSRSSSMVQGESEFSPAEIERSSAHNNIMINPEITSDKNILLAALKQLLKTDNRSTALLNDIAITAITLESYEEAEEFLNQSLSVDQENARTFFILGLLSSRIDDFEGSEKAYNQALEINPGYQLASLNLGIIYLNNGKLNEAEQFFRKTVESSSGDIKARSLQLLGVSLIRQKEYERAAEYLRRAIDYNPRSARLWYEYARAISRLAVRSEETIDALKKSIALDNSYTRSHYLLGLRYEDMGLFKEALKSFQSVIRLDPMHKGARKHIADILESLGQIKGAKVHLQWLAKNAEFSVDRVMIQSRISELDGDMDNAIGVLEEEINNARSPDRNLLKRLGLLLRKTDQYEKSIKVYQGYMDLFSEDADAYVGAAGSALGLGDAAKAAEHIEKGLLIDNDDPNLWFMRGRVMSELDLEDEAISSYSTCLELRPGYSSCALNLAVIKTGNDQYEEVVAIYQRILGQSPNYMTARKNLAAVLKRMGKNSEAKDQYERILELDAEELSGFTGLAEVNILEGNFDQAESLLKDALELEPSNTDNRYRLAEVYQMKQDMYGFETELSRTLRLNPDYLPAILALGDYYFDSKQPEKAAEMYKRALLADPKNYRAIEQLSLLSP